VELTPLAPRSWFSLIPRKRPVKVLPLLPIETAAIGSAGHGARKHGMFEPPIARKAAMFHEQDVSQAGAWAIFPAGLPG